MATAAKKEIEVLCENDSNPDLVKEWGYEAFRVEATPLLDAAAAEHRLLGRALGDATERAQRAKVGHLQVPQPTEEAKRASRLTHASASQNIHSPIAPREVQLVPPSLLSQSCSLIAPDPKTLNISVATLWT